MFSACFQPEFSCQQAVGMVEWGMFVSDVMRKFRVFRSFWFLEIKACFQEFKHNLKYGKCPQNGIKSEIYRITQKALFLGQLKLFVNDDEKKHEIISKFQT